MIDTIMVVGCGGLGTWCAIACQFKCNKLYVIDYDIVSRSNLNRLPFMINEYKVDELKRYITRASYYPIKSEYTKNLLQVINPSIVIDCTDNIETQNKIYNDVYTEKGRKSLLIRAGTNDKSITILTPPYTIWGNEENEQRNQCGVTVQQCIQTQFIAAGYVAELVDNYRQDVHVNFNIGDIYGK